MERKAVENPLQRVRVVQPAPGRTKVATDWDSSSNKPSKSLWPPSLPQVLDLVTDRVRFRPLLPSLLFLIFALLASLILQPVFHDPYNARQSALQLSQLSVAVYPSQTAASGRLIPVQPAVRALSAFGDPIPNAAVTVTVRPTGAKTVNILEGGRTVINGSALSYVVDLLSAVQLSGNVTITTTQNGYAFFDDLVLTGEPGPVELSFASDDGAVLLAEAVVVSLTTDVAAMEALFPAPDLDQDFQIPLGQPFPVQPVVRLTDASGRPVVGRRCSVGTVWFSNPMDAVIEKLAVFETGPASTPNTFSSMSQPSNESGIAEWDDLRIIDSNTRTQAMVMNCEGIMGLYAQGFSLLTSAVAVTLSWHDPLVPLAREGGPIPSQPSVRLLDAAGAPVVGRRVFARMTQIGQAIVPPGFPACVYCSVGITPKALTNVISLPSDASGVAKFESLGFSQHGFGNESYTISIDTMDAAVSLSGGPVYVVSGVHAVSIVGPTTSSALLDPVCSVDGTCQHGFLDPQPVISVIDQQGRGMAGKFVRIIAVPKPGEPRDVEMSTDLLTVTGSDGYLQFEQLRVAASWTSGLYAVRFSVDGVLSAPFNVNVTNLHAADANECSFVALLSDPVGVVHVNRLLEPFPVAQVRNFRGRDGGSGWTLIARASANLGPSITAPNKTTNGTGVAVFNDIGDIQYSNGSFLYQLLGARDGRLASPLCATQWSLATVVNPIASLRLETPSTITDCVAGQPLDPIRVTPLDPSGVPVFGYHYATFQVFYFPEYLVSYPHLKDVFPDCLPFLNNPTKGTGCDPAASQFFFDNIVLAGSAAVGADGTLEWPSVTVKNAGYYVLAPYVDGFVGSLLQWGCRSPVASVGVHTQPSTSPPLSVGTSSVQGLAAVVKDSSGVGVAGKRVSVVVDRTRTTPFPDSVLLGQEPERPTSSGGVTFFTVVSEPSNTAGVATFASDALLLAAADTAPDSGDGELALAMAYAPGGVYPHLSPATSIDRVPFTSPLAGVAITREPSSLAAFGTALSVQPVVRVFPKSGEAAAGHLVIPRLCSSCCPSALTCQQIQVVDASGAAALAVTDANGVAVFTSLTLSASSNVLGLTNAPALEGKYHLSFHVSGLVSARSDGIELTTVPQVLTLKDQPPAVATVGEMFSSRVLVRATLSNGAAVAGASVRLRLLTAPSTTAQLDLSRSEDTTDGNGFVSFLPQLTAGVSGNYTLQAYVLGGPRSSATTLIRVTNPVHTIDIVSQPSSSATVGANLLQQPVVRVTDVSGRPLPNLVVLASVNAPAGNAVVQAAPVVTAADGTATFRGLGFIKGSTGAYSIVFLVRGVESPASVTISVTNKNDYDTSSLANWKVFMYVVAALIVPLFYSAGQSSLKLSLVVALCWSALLLAFAINTAVVASDFVGSVYERPDPFLNFLVGVLIAAATAVFFQFLYLVVLAYSRKRTSSASTLSQHYKLVRRLLPRGQRIFEANLEALRAFRAGVKPSMVGAAETKKGRPAGEGRIHVPTTVNPLSRDVRVEMAVLARRSGGGTGSGTGGGGGGGGKDDKLLLDKDGTVSSDASSTTDPDNLSFADRRSQFFDTVKARLRVLWNPPQSKTAQYETTDTFLASLRLWMAATASAFIVLLGSAAFTLLAVLARYQIDQVFKQIQAWQIDVVDQARRQAGSVGITQTAINIASDAADAAGTVVDDGISMAQSQVDSGSDAARALAAVAEFRSWSLDDIQDWLKDCVAVGAGVGIAVSVVAMIVMWIFMWRKYRSRVMRMRRGVYFFDRTMFGVKAAVTYIPLQTWHTFLAFVALCFILSIVSAFTYALFTKGLWILKLIPWGKLLLSLVTVTLIINIVEKVVLGCIVTRGQTVIHIKLFQLMDLALMFTGFASGLMHVVARFATTFAFNVLFFARIDLSNTVESAAWLDPAYHAYVSMVILDHSLSNPIVSVAADMMIRDMRWRQTNTSSMSATKRRAIAKVWLAVTLHNNPQLIVLRNAQTKGAKLNPLYNLLGGNGVDLALRQLL